MFHERISWQQIAQQCAFADVVAFMLGDVADRPGVGDLSASWPLDDPVKVGSG